MKSEELTEGAELLSGQGTEGREEAHAVQSGDSTQRHGKNHTERHNPVHAPIPGLGLRSIKTALAAFRGKDHLH